MIGDVSGHGYRAALIMALAMSASAIHAQTTIDPAETLAALLASRCVTSWSRPRCSSRLLRRDRPDRRCAALREHGAPARVRDHGRRTDFGVCRRSIRRSA